MSSEQLRPPPRTYDYSSGADSQYSDSSYPQGSTPFLIPPSGPFPEHSLSPTPRESSYGAPDPAYNSDPLLGSSDAIASNIPNAYLAKEGYAVHTNPSNWHVRKPLYKRPLFWFGALVALAVVVLAVVLPIIFVVVKPNQHHHTSANTGTNQNSDPGSSSTGGNGDPASSTGATTGGDGSTVTTADGSTFVYKNQFGGYWVSDPKNPFDNSARPNSWTPPLNTSWTWGEDHIYGVNLGGLFVLEPFIVPTIYQESTGSVDEWTLSTLLSQNGSLQSALEDHYNTFITEQDIAEIAGAGLNWIRLPIPFWAIETWADVGVDASGNNVAEPFLAQVCWKYILRVIGWARKYGIRINLDLHTAPGSQNGYNHSGKLGQVNFLNGPMGIANAERMLDYIRIITEFISQPEYKDVIPMFGIINEALLSAIGRDQLSAFYLRAHDMIRSITGIGAGNGPFISIHDGFQGMSSWANFLTGSDRIALDTHPYFAFDGQPNTQPINVTAVGGDGVEMGGVWPKQACNSWGPQMNASRNNFGVSIAGEFSNGYNDCGLFVEGVGGTPHFGGDCSFWMDSSQWDVDTKAGLLNFALASMDALGDWFFWTWKIGNSTANIVQSPLWSYQLGLQGGWMPTDPRTALGKCAHFGVSSTPFDGTFQSWQTGGAGAGTIAATASASFGDWPPTTIANVDAASVTLMPQYTSTASLVTLPAPTLTAATVSLGNGWVDPQDTAPKATAISGCAYPDAWSALSSAFPTTGCGAVATPAALVTSALVVTSASVGTSIPATTSTSVTTSVSVTTSASVTSLPTTTV